MSTKGVNGNIPGPDFWKNMASSPKGKKGKNSIRITIPPGEGFKIMKIAEVSSEAGATITLNLPFPMGEAGLSKIFDSLRQAGATVETINE